MVDNFQHEFVIKKNVALWNGRQLEGWKQANLFWLSPECRIWIADHLSLILAFAYSAQLDF